jgi:methionyl aminopeptidase
LFFKKQRIELKTIREIKKIEIAGEILGKMLHKLSEIIRPEITTESIDVFSSEYIRSSKMIPAFLGVRGINSTFPASACVSVNNEVVHGIPKASRILKSGDIVSVDIGVFYDGYYADAARTYIVGDTSDVAKKLLKVTELSLEKGIEQMLPGNRLGDISYAIQKTAESNGFSVVRDFVGHGIGRFLHEAPQIPNFGRANTGVKLLPGMVFAIEPMLNVGSCEVCMMDDGWTVITKDASLSAHFEHTVAITESGYKILTKV